MLVSLKEFCGWTKNRTPEGWFSWQHLLFVSSFAIITIILAIFLGKRTKKDSIEKKQKVLGALAIAMALTELLGIVVTSFRAQDPWHFRSKFPLYLCSIPLIILPFTTFKSRITKFCTYFIAVYGPLCSIAGTFLAANYYNKWPVLNFDVLNSTITHYISGLAGLYIFTSGIMDEYDVRKNRAAFFCSSLVLIPISGLAIAANALNAGTAYDDNYMFLSNSSGTPFSIVEKMTGQNPVLYTATVILIYLSYGFLFTMLFYNIKKHRKNSSAD